MSSNRLRAPWPAGPARRAIPWRLQQLRGADAECACQREEGAKRQVLSARLDLLHVFRSNPDGFSKLCLSKTDGLTQLGYSASNVAKRTLLVRSAHRVGLQCLPRGKTQALNWHFFLGRGTNDPGVTVTRCEVREMGFRIFIAHEDAGDWRARIYAATPNGFVAIGEARGPWDRVMPVIALAEIYVILWSNDLAACERLIGVGPSPPPQGAQ